MEADICEENVSVSAANIIDDKVSDNIDERSKVEYSAEITTENVTDQTVIDSDDKSQNDDNSLSDNKEDDYYEVISADGSVGEDDIDNANTNNNNNIGTSDEQVNLTHAGPGGFGVSSSSVDRSRSEPCSFIDLPFVPKFEFPLDSSQSENVSNYGAFHINRFISDIVPRPDKNFTVPPPNYYRPLEPLDIKPSFDSVQGPILNAPVHTPTFIAKDEIVSAVSEKPSDIISSSQVVDKLKELKNLPGPSRKKDPVVDWVDENGDPLPGAFDYVKPNEPNEEHDLSEQNTRVEYVFSVREKKDVPVDSNEPCVLNSGFLISQNVLHKNVAGNLGVSLRLAPGPSGIARKGNEDEEKKLYEASKRGAEYKAAVEAITTLSSTTNTSINRVVAENETAKKDRLPRFRRNRFADIKKEDDQQDDEPAEAIPQKSAEEAALENQAVTEILKEVQRGAARAKEVGALGWQKCPIPVTNKTFLRNTLVSTLREPYRPPSKRGRFHVGLKANDDKGKHHKTRDDDRSSSSRSSRSRSSSRSHSSSRSGSSYTDDEHSGSRDRRNQFSQRGRGSWNRGPQQYYDDAWAAYAAHYGYPWYGPEALPMFYGPEGWPMDPYATMYYGDPQAWMEYEAYYGPPNFGPRGMGRGFRGRGRGDRGRGRGGYEGDFRGYNFGARSPREYSRSHSRSGPSRSWSRDQSRSRSRANSVEMRGRSRSTSQDRTQRQSRHRPRSKDRSLQGESGDKTASDAETSEKKKKKKKKKKKHKKLKKSKHRQKSDDGKSSEKNAAESVDDIAENANISIVDADKEKPEETKIDSDDLVKKSDVAKLGKRKEHTKYKGGDKGEKEETKKVKERKDDNKARENVSEKEGQDKSKGENKRTVDESSGGPKKDKHTLDISEDQEKDTRKQKEKVADHHDGENNYIGSSSHGSGDKSKIQDLRITKLKGKIRGSNVDVSGDKIISQVDRKGNRKNDNKVICANRDNKYDDSDSKTSGQVKQDVTDRRRRYHSSDIDEESRLTGGKYKYGEDIGGLMHDKRGSYRDKDQRDTSGAKVDRGESPVIGEGYDANMYSRGRVSVECDRSGSRERPDQDSVKYKQRRGGTQSVRRSESYDSQGSSGGAGRNKKDGHKYKHSRDVTGRNRSRESNDSTRKHGMIDNNYKTRNDITSRDGRSEIRGDEKRAIMEGCKDGRSVRYGLGRSEGGDDGERDGKKEWGQKMGRDIQEGSGRSHIRDSQERIRKLDYKEGRGESSFVTKSDRQLENPNIRQTSKVGGNKDKNASLDTQRESENSDNKERNKLVSRQKILQIGNKEISDKKAAGFNKDIQRRRRRSTSSDSRDQVDDNLDKVLTTRIISVTSVGSQKQRTNEKEVNNHEDRSGFEGKHSERPVKSVKKRIHGDEKNTVDKEMTQGRLKKSRERKDDGTSTRNEKNDAMGYRDGKILLLNTSKSKILQGSEQYEENNSSEKPKHKRVIKVTQVSKESGASTNKNNTGVKNQSHSRDSNEHGEDIHDEQKHVGVIDRSGTVSKDETEEKAESRPKDVKGVKRKKKTIKTVGAKKIRPSAVEEDKGGENLIIEGSGKTSETGQKQLKSEHALNKESVEETIENIHGAEVECNK